MTTDSTLHDDSVCSIIRLHRVTYGPYGHMVMHLTDIFDDYSANNALTLTVRAQAGTDREDSVTRGFYAEKIGIESRSLNGPIDLYCLKVANKFLTTIHRRLDKMQDKEGYSTSVTDSFIRVLRAIGVRKVRVAYKILNDSSYTPMNWPVRHLNDNSDLATLGSELTVLESELLRQVYPHRVAS